MFKVGDVVKCVDNDGSFIGRGGEKNPIMNGGVYKVSGDHGTLISLEGVEGKYFASRFVMNCDNKVSFDYKKSSRVAFDTLLVGESFLVNKTEEGYVKCDDNAALLYVKGSLPWRVLVPKDTLVTKTEYEITFSSKG